MKRIFTLFAALIMAAGMYAQVDTPLYTADAYTYHDEAYDEEDTGYFPETEGIKVEGYEGYVIVRGLGGVEGYDMMVEYDEDDNITGITPIVNGEEGATKTKGYCSINTGLDDASWKYFQAYISTGYCYGSSNATTQSGYLFLNCYNAQNVYSYYYLYWSNNLMDESELTLASCWWANENWGQIASPEVAIEYNEATITVAEANGNLQWQGQVHLNTGVAIQSGNTYTFAITLNATQDINGATVKPHPAGDDGHFFSQARHNLTANTDQTVVYADFVADFSTDNLVITLDFPSCQAGTVITATDITILLTAEAEQVDLSWDMTGNLWPAANVSLTHWYSGAGWGGGLTPQIDDSKANREYKVVVPEGIGGSEWMGQTHFTADIPVSSAHKYNFAVTLKSSVDCTVTAKLAWEGNDKDHAMFYDNSIRLTAGEEVQVKKINVMPDVDYDKLALFIDLGRTPAGAEVIIKDFVLIDVDSTDGISNVTSDKAHVNGIYNLAGQRVEKMQRGLYIVGGKKVMVK